MYVLGNTDQQKLNVHVCHTVCQYRGMSDVVCTVTDFKFLYKHMKNSCVGTVFEEEDKYDQDNT